MTWLFRRLSALTRSRPLASKMASFAAIGVGNTVLDFAVFTAAFKLLELPLIPSNVLAWLVAVSFSYVLNTRITFRAETGRVLKWRDYLGFVASGTVGVIANTTTLVLLSHVVSVLTAKLGAIAVSFVVNFAMSHFVVFRPKLPSNP